MGLTTERKVFLGLACVAGLALVIDQGFMGPKQASADIAPADSSPPASETVSVPTSAPAGKPAAMVLIDRLESLALSDQGESLGASFSLTKLVEPSIGLPITDGTSTSEQEEDSTASFPLIAPKANDLPILSSVMPAKNGGGAVLGGKLLRVGQVDPNGYRLVLVHARSVLVERDGVQYAIEIPTISGHE